jgi:hypothetical protein
LGTAPSYTRCCLDRRVKVLPADLAFGAHERSGGTVLADRGSADRRGGALFDRLNTAVGVEVGRRVARVDGIDFDRGEALAYWLVTMLSAALDAG